LSFLWAIKITCSASGNSLLVLFVTLLYFGGIMLCIGRGVGGTEKLWIYRSFFLHEAFATIIECLPITRFGHFKSDVGDDKSCGHTHFDVLSEKLRQAASFPQMCGWFMHPVISMLSVGDNSIDPPTEWLIAEKFVVRLVILSFVFFGDD